MVEQLAAVADLVPAARRATGYGVFTAVYGITWLAAPAAIGVLYAVSVTAVIAFVAAAQLLALAVFLALLARAPAKRESSSP